MQAKIRHRVLILMGMALAALAPPAPAESAADPAASAAPAPPALVEQPTSGTLELLAELERRHGAHKTIRAEFDQIRRDEIFEEEHASTGRLWFQRDPELFRVDYAAPQAMITLVRPDALYSYIDELNQVEYWAFSSPEEYRQQLHTLLLGFGFKAQELVGRYEIHSSRDEPAVREDLAAMGHDPALKELLVFRPRPAHREQSPFTLLKVVIDKDSLLPEKIWYEDHAENQMTIKMQNVELGAEIDPARFDPRNPSVFPRNATFIDKRDVL